MSVIRIAGVVNDSIVDGPGIRMTIFFQGCAHNCPGCHNPHTHDPEGGEETTVEGILAKIDRNPLLDGVTFSGGEPFSQAAGIAPLAREIRGRGLGLIIYSGFTFEEIVDNAEFLPLLECADWLIDGRFVLAEKTLELPYVGSRNQRVIDVKKSLACGCVVLADI